MRRDVRRRDGPRRHRLVHRTQLAFGLALTDRPNPRHGPRG
ncbi:hypothetical protein A7982_13511 [Minicystis rosea]|nr:hypothetical protein A7982_13511 [Minicystis rosea]